MRGGVLVQKVAGQELDVLSPVDQRRRGDGDDVEAVEEIAPELALVHGPLQFLVGGGDEAQVHGNLLRAAQSDHDLLLQGPQELGLHGQGHVAYLVEKERAAVGLFEQTFLEGAGASVGFLLVPEELVFQEIVAEAGAVDREKALVSPGAEMVDGPGHQLLARAGLPEDEDARAYRRHLGDMLPQGHDGGRLAHDLGDVGVRGAAAQVFELPGHGVFFQGLADQRPQLVEFVRLGQVMVGALVHGLDRGLDCCEASEHDDFGLWLKTLDRAENAHAVHVAHAQVGEHDVEVVLAEQLQGGLAIGSGLDAIALAPQHMDEIVAGDLLVLDDHYAGCACHSSVFSAGWVGMRMVKAVPTPSWLSTVILPPCFSIMP